MIKLLTIVGARPQIIKAAALSRAISIFFSNEIMEIIVHTGQHYDSNMSQIFFDELNIPIPNYNLNVGSGTHGQQTAIMIEGLEKLMISEKPDFVVVYGDTNSTLAASIAASKIHIPVVHIEAGLRSFNKKMPEEINRIMSDHSSTLLFTPTHQGYLNLVKEGFRVVDGPYSIDNPGIFHCGDVMLDNSLYFKDLIKNNSSLFNDLKIYNENFILATVHRAENTDNPVRLESILIAFLEIVSISNVQLVFPIHPRTFKKLESINPLVLERVKANSRIKLIEPVSFLEMIELESCCSMVITDSGGVQKEAYFFKKPCLILREETEWVEIVETGSSILVGANRLKILEAYFEIKNGSFDYPEIFGDGRSAEFICKKILEN